MKQLRLALNLLKRFIPQSLLLIAELVLTLLLITDLINSYNWEMREYNAFQHEEFTNALYFSGKIDSDSINVTDSKEGKELYQYLKNQKEFVGLSDTDQFLLSMKNQNGAEETFDVFVADKVTCKILGVDESFLFNQEQIKNGVLPALMITGEKESAKESPFVQGDQYPGKIESVYRRSAENDAVNKDVILDFKKIIHDNMILYPRYTARTTIDISYYSLTENVKSGSRVIIVPKVEELFGGYEEAPFWILLSPDISQQRKAEIVQQVRKYGHVSEKENADKETMKGITYRLEKKMMNSSMLLCLSILGLFSLSFLSVKQLSKRFSIYYLCGYSKKKAMGLYAVYIYLIGALSVLIYYAVTIIRFYFPWNFQMELSFYKYQSFNAAGGLSILFCFMLITLFSLVPFILNYRKSSFEMYRL